MNSLDNRATVSATLTPIVCILLNFSLFIKLCRLSLPFIIPSSPYLLTAVATLTAWMFCFLSPFGPEDPQTFERFSCPKEKSRDLLGSSYINLLGNNLAHFGEKVTSLLLLNKMTSPISQRGISASW